MIGTLDTKVKVNKIELDGQNEIKDLKGLINEFSQIF